LLVIFLQNLNKVFGGHLLRVQFFPEAAFAQLQDHIFKTSCVENLPFCLLANETSQFIRTTDLDPLRMLFWGEVYYAPVFKEPVDADYQRNISH
jgi:hypothetical protein